MGLCCLSDRLGSEEAVRSHRSEATKLSGAQMPEQRRAGHSFEWCTQTPAHTVRPARKGGESPRRPARQGRHRARPRTDILGQSRGDRPQTKWRCASLRGHATGQHRSHPRPLPHPHRRRGAPNPEREHRLLKTRSPLGIPSSGTGGKLPGHHNFRR